MESQRARHLSTFYSVLDALEATLGGARELKDCSGRLAWPKRGVYFFRERGEFRSGHGQEPRIVRVGTHALKTGSRTSLWSRLSQHKGQQSSGGGNHRGSVFRLLVGAALNGMNGYGCPTWGSGHSAPRDVRTRELELERAVSRAIGCMPFLWLGIEDEAGPESQRAFIERNAIALLSNYSKPAVDAPSASWLGNHSDRERVRDSGLWNCNHVDDDYDPGFLDQLGRLVASVRTS